MRTSKQKICIAYLTFVCFYLRIFKQQIKDKGFVTSWLQTTPESIVFLSEPKALSILIYRSLILLLIIIIISNTV